MHKDYMRVEKGWKQRALELGMPAFKSPRATSGQGNVLLASFPSYDYEGEK